MPKRYPALLTALLALAALSAATSPARAQLTLIESGFVFTELSGDFAKQVELGVGPDTCLYYGSFEGLKRLCSPSGTATICDSSLIFPVGIAFSTSGAFGSAMYVADYAVGDVHRSVGCSPSTLFATLPGPGALAFPPSGSAYGNFLYGCEAFSGPISRISSTGVVTTWLALETAYLKFGPGGVWGTGLYATDYSSPAATGIDRVTSAGVVTSLIGGQLQPEGFDWAFGGDLFATDAATGEILRVKSNGAKTVFATLPGAADVAYRPGEDALYVVSNQGGLYRIRRGSTTAVDGVPWADAAARISPNPARGACALRFAQRESGLARVNVVDAQGRTVRRLPATWRPAGAQTLAWDGRDDGGAPVHPGAYFMRVVAGRESSTARVMIVR